MRVFRFRLRELSRVASPWNSDSILKSHVSVPPKRYGAVLREQSRFINKQNLKLCLFYFLLGYEVARLSSLSASARNTTYSRRHCV